jgi:hypothetical protein
MRCRVTTAFVLLGLGLGARALAAQGDIRLGLGAGVSIPVRSYASAVDRGWLGVVNLTYFPAAVTSLGFRLDGLYGRSPLDGFDGRTSYKGGTASLVFQFGARRSPNRFYVFGGGGYVRTVTSGPGFGTAHATNPALSAGAGASLGSRAFAVFFEARYLNVYNGGVKPQLTPLIAGVSFGGL